jgi:hypothetical protein
MGLIIFKPNIEMITEANNSLLFVGKVVGETVANH